jgi:hypothetical protein
MKFVIPFSALALFSLLFTHCQCTPEPNCVELPGGKKYECAAEVQVSPSQTNYQPGDSIWFNIVLPAQVKALGDSTNITTSKLVFDDLFCISSKLYFDSNGQARSLPGESFLNYHSSVGDFRITGTGSSLIGNFDFATLADGARQLKLLVIPRQEGIYSIAFSTGWVVTTGFFDDYCYAETQLLFHLPDDRDSGNYHLARPYQSLLGTYEDYQKTGTFTFQVLE